MADDFFAKQLPHNVTWALTVLYALDAPGDLSSMAVQVGLPFVGVGSAILNPSRWVKLGAAATLHTLNTCQAFSLCCSLPDTVVGDRDASEWCLAPFRHWPPLASLAHERVKSGCK